tara:strand:+ start:79 stop:807 length:729 start_codon:yes stop_codon:yes gene_type:complete
MSTPHTLDKMTRDLRQLGVEEGTTLFMHSSFKSLGLVAGGAATVIAALQEALGPQGLLLLPSFHLIERDQRAAKWDHGTTASTVGWLTEFFRQMPGTYRSNHYSHSVAARGKGAREFVADHLSNEGHVSPWDLVPWGATYGTHSPMYRAYRANGQLLMLGVDYETSTYIHLVEVLYWGKLRRRDPQATYPGINRPALGAFWDRRGKLQQGRVGDSPCRLFRIGTYVDALLAEVEHNPDPYVN